MTTAAATLHAEPAGAPGDTRLAAWLWLVALASLALRQFIASTFPITGDEAFFYWWGVYPNWGYYDHPPMVGWWLAGVRAALGDAAWAIRLPAVLLPLVLGGLLGWGLAGLPHPQARARAAWAVLLFWLAPINWLFMLITTDTPLIFWSVLSVALLLRAESRPALDRATLLLYAASGVAIGCAFLSKYFAVVLGLAYLVYFALYRRERFAGLLLLVACALPGPLLNLAFNYQHGWPNIMFNAINRHGDAGFAWTKPLGYAALLAYLITPVALWAMARHWRNITELARAHRLLACLVLVPLAFFALLSMRKVVGLHWVLAFYPFGFALLALGLPQPALPRLARGLAIFTALHLLVVALLYASSLSTWRDSSLYQSIVRSYRTEALLAQVDQPNTVLMAGAYTPASVYGYTLRRYVPVFGRGNFHARQDDLLVDFSVYQGKTIRVLLGGAPQLSEFTPYFTAVRTWTVEQDGARFHVVEGQGFDYPAYQRGVLSDIYRRYYQIPGWLPDGGCPFCVRLCGLSRCSP